MRLWSFHPKYLDAKGLTAVWREGLLAMNVLQGKTKGYKNHPQLSRFKETSDPVQSISAYLTQVCLEADCRGYHFSRGKIPEFSEKVKPVFVTEGQLKYEWEWYLSKIEKRDHDLFLKWKDVRQPETHLLFKLVPGPVADWEKIK